MGEEIGLGETLTRPVGAALATKKIFWRSMKVLCLGSIFANCVPIGDLPSPSKQMAEGIIGDIPV